MRSSSLYQFLLGMSVTLAGCLAPLADAGARCTGTVGPSVRAGSLNLSPTVVQVPPGPRAVPVTLAVLTFPATSAPPAFQLSFPRGGKTVTQQMQVFELCVVPKSKSLPLGNRVATMLEDPAPGSPSAQSWQFFFGGVFITSLQRTHNGPLVQLDVDAQNLNNSFPAGVQPSARMLITFILPDGRHNLDLTVERK